MLAGQWKARSGVVEGGVCPVDGVVTRRTLGDGEAGGDVIRDVATQSLCAVPLREMAGGVAAVGGLNSEIVVVIDVAVRTGRGGMSACQGEAGDRVIEGVVGPGDGVVAGGTIHSREGSSGGGMRGIVGGLPGGKVTAGIAAISGLNIQSVIVVDVALSAGGDFTSGSELVGVG